MERGFSIPLALVAALIVAGCEGSIPDSTDGGGEETPETETDSVARPDGGMDVPDAIDATFGEGGEFLGTTVASLGDPNDTGFWVRTPLVGEPVRGHVHYPGSGRSVRVELIPSGGARGGGSRISLAAMRLLDAPITELLELAVYRS